MSLACILVAGGKRADLLDNVILPQARVQRFAELLVVGTHHPGVGYRYLEVPPLSHTTNDALVKRDVGTLATTADWLWYLSDDHFPVWRWHNALEDADVIVPKRWTGRLLNGEQEHVTRIDLNNGEADSYCGGHGGIYKRWVIQALPWSAGPHHREWDLLMSRRQQALGATFLYHPQSVEIVDVEPGAEPWR